MHHDAPQGTSQPVPEGQYGGISPPPHHHHITAPPPSSPSSPPPPPRRYERSFELVLVLVLMTRNGVDGEEEVDEESTRKSMSMQCTPLHAMTASQYCGDSGEETSPSPPPPPRQRYERARWMHCVQILTKVVGLCTSVQRGGQIF